MKKFSEISLPITEEEYRNDGCMHYSTLAKFERSGFHGLETLFDKVESPSLLLGSIVDTLLTDGQDAFDSQYVVSEFPEISDQIANVVKGLFEVYKDNYSSLNDVPDAAILSVLDSIDYGKTWRSTTRLEKVRKPGVPYYELLYLCKDKTLVSNEMYADACNMVEAVRTSKATAQLFAPNNPFDTDTERYYQLKFRHTVDGIDYSCMADLIYVNYKHKFIIPVDLKTSSHYEDEFYKSFIQWNYQIQARSYWRNIRAAMDNDDYFKDFELKNYHFVVVNKKTLTPLVWECPFTKDYGSIFVGKDKQIELRDPYDIAKELKYYLDSTPSVSKGISISSPNNLSEWLNKM